MRDWYLIADQPAPAPHLAHPEGCAALRIVLVTVPRVSRSCEHFPDGFDLHLLHLHMTYTEVLLSLSLRGGADMAAVLAVMKVSRSRLGGGA